MTLFYNWTVTTQNSVDFLASADHWYMDGTFDSVPPQFQQLYTIHGIKDGRNIIGCYALLTDKLEITYERLLRHVQYFTGLSPVTMNTGFERAAMNACATVFPQSNVRCCFSHLCQNVFRKVKENRLQALYEDLNNPFRIHVKMICSLAFVPPLDVGRAFDLLCLQFDGVRGHPYSNIHCGMYMIAS